MLYSHKNRPKDIQTDITTYRQTERQIHKRTDRQIHRKREDKRDIKTQRQKILIRIWRRLKMLWRIQKGKEMFDRQTEGYIDRHKERQTDRQPDRYTEREMTREIERHGDERFWF